MSFHNFFNVDTPYTISHLHRQLNESAGAIITRAWKVIRIRTVMWEHLGLWLS